MADKLVESLAKVLGRREFLAKLTTAAIVAASGILAVPLTAEASVYRCCVLCLSPTSCTGCSCKWCWGCCDLSDHSVWSCCECYNSSGSCSGNCSGVIHSCASEFGPPGSC